MAWVKPTIKNLPLMCKNHELFNSRIARAFLALGNFEAAKKLGDGLFRLGLSFSLKQERVHVQLCTARAHRALGEGKDESRLFKEAFECSSDSPELLIALAELFPNCALEQKKLLVEQHRKLENGEAIDFDVIQTFWEAV